jgi:hypothetical protein
MTMTEAVISLAAIAGAAAILFCLFSDLPLRWLARRSLDAATDAAVARDAARLPIVDQRLRQLDNSLTQFAGDALSRVDQQMGELERVIEQNVGQQLATMLTPPQQISVITSHPEPVSVITSHPPAMTTLASGTTFVRDLSPQVLGRPFETAHVTGRVVATPPVSVQPPWNPPGMRLPSPFKTAFDSDAIFKQQKDMRTHDIGLQSLLDAVFQALWDLHQVGGDRFGDWDRTKFVVNFGTPPKESERRFVFTFTFPVIDRFEVFRTTTPDFGPAWHITSQKLNLAVTVSGSNPRLMVPASLSDTPNSEPTVDTDGRELRAITLD